MIRLLSCAWLGLLTLAGGCNVISYIAAVTPGPGTKAYYTGLAGQRVAVLAWADRAVTFDYAALPADISMGVANKLQIASAPSMGTEELKGTTYVDPRQVFRWQKNHPELATRSIAEVAPKLAADLGATRVIYVEISPFTLYDPRTPVLLKGYATMTLHVAEVNGQNVKIGYQESDVTVEFPDKAPEGLPPTDSITPTYIYRGLIDTMTTEVAKRFFSQPGYRRMTHIALNICRMALVLLLGMAAGGCAIPSAILYKVVGPPPTPARFRVPQIPLLVLVENAHSGATALPETDALAQVVYEELAANKVAPLVDPGKVHDLRDRNPATFGKMSISQVGREVGAQQVLYIHVTQLEIESPPASELVRVRITANVQVVDTANAHTVWPDGGDSEPYGAESPWQRIEAGTNRSSLNHQVLRESGEEIARWFYDYKPETMKEENKSEKLR